MTSAFPGQWVMAHIYKLHLLPPLHILIQLPLLPKRTQQIICGDGMQERHHVCSIATFLARIPRDSSYEQTCCNINCDHNISFNFAEYLSFLFYALMVYMRILNVFSCRFMSAFYPPFKREITLLECSKQLLIYISKNIFP